MTIVNHEHKRDLFEGTEKAEILDGSNSLDYFRLMLGGKGANPMLLSVHPAHTFKQEQRTDVVSLTFKSVHCEGCWAQVLFSHEEAEGIITAIRASMNAK